MNPWFDLYCQDRLVASFAKRQWAIDFIKDFPYNGSAYVQSDFTIVEKEFSNG